MSSHGGAPLGSWIRKRAFLKAIGDSLSFPLNASDVSVDPNEPARLLRIGGDSKRASRWFIHDFKPAPGFTAALAVEGHDWRLHYLQWSD